MDKYEECSVCEQEFDVRDMFEDLDGDEFTCKACMQKMEEAGELSEPRYYFDRSEVPRGVDEYDSDEKEWD